jgi:predicted 3-demethylubiquinone-9 3-methyltransferase (glyoxalase superfamily)
MQKITPFLWFDSNAEQAINFYVSIFKNSKKENINRYDEVSAKASGRPMGSVMTASFQLAGQNFTALNGGPIFKFTPAVSFYVNCESENEIDKLWDKLSDHNTKIFWQLQKYPWSEKYGWLTDKFGISWQLTLTNTPQKICPFLSFFGNQYGKAEEAINYYTTIFKNSGIQNIARYTNEEEKTEGTIKHAAFTINGQEFKAMESIKDLPNFNEAISFVVNCENQNEVDYFWDELTKGGDEKAQQCGWLKDKYGLSWQVVPKILFELLIDKDAEKSRRVMQAMLQMKKIEIAELEKAYNESLNYAVEK